ncbi:MAG TPA: hypothetical protein VME66_08080 [Candidatus Acidoferrales bacterium]|nr:hypothetical protein [Candidatus Acidoferrales bacterium]
MLTMLEPIAGARHIFVTRPMPNGTQVLVPRLMLPRTCRRLDGVTKISYATRADAKAARTKHDEVYRCANCGAYHLATKHKPGSERPIGRAVRARAA